MAEHQRIHPVDVEAGGKTPKNAPTAPLMPHGTAVSDMGDPLMYPPQNRTFPVAHSTPPKRRRSCFCRCICWSLCLILVFIVLLGITAGALYLIYRPKIPHYSIEQLRVSSFNVDENLSTVNASFNVTVKATNPNDKIGIYYVGGSHLSVSYSDKSLCNGTLPVFYQGHHNTTVLYVTMAGETQYDDGDLTELQAAQEAGAVPLKIRGTVPVRVKFGGLKLFKVKFSVRCNVVVSSLVENQEVDITSSHCKLKLKL